MSSSDRSTAPAGVQPGANIESVAPPKMVLGIHEFPKSPLKAFLLAYQHVFAMFGATILVPILVNSLAGETVLTIPVALVTSGIGTWIYILLTRGGSPVYLGSSFAFIGPLATAYAQSGIGGAMTGIMVIGVIYLIVALIINRAGKGWIDRLLPPIVVGPMIMIIGLSLAGSAVSQMGLDAAELDWRGALVALIAFLSTAVIAVAGRGFSKIIPVLLGIAIGYVSAIVLGLVDFTPVVEASIFQMPAFVFPFVHYQLDFSAVPSIGPIALVTMSEHIGDHTTLSRIVGKDLLRDPGLDRTLAGDGLATMVAAMLGGPANTTYGENTSVVGMTRVASVGVIGLAAILAIILGFIGKFTAIVATIPGPVLGGVSIAMYGFIASSGLRVLGDNHVNFGKIRNVMIASAMLVLGLGGAQIPLKILGISLTISGMSLAAILGILMNLFLPAETEASV